MLDSTQPILSDFSRIYSEVIGILPQLAAALLLLLVGWLIAKLLRSLTIRSAGLMNRALVRVGLGRAVESGTIKETTVRIIAGIVFWLVILFFLASATNVLGLSMFAGWLDQVVAYLPKIVSGVLIIFAGVVLANIVRDGIEAAFGSMPQAQRMLIARGSQFFTLGLLIIVGLDQIGIDITVVTTVLAIVLGSALGGLAIAFSLGARTFVANLIGAHYLGDDYRPGERVRIEKAEGVIIEVTHVAVILETAEGRLTIPARLFSEQATLIVSGKADHASDA
mgnify:CR=1 FL=1